MASLMSLKSRLNQLSGQDVSLSEDDADLDSSMNTTEEASSDTNPTTLLLQIQEQGNRPEDWLEYIKMIQENTPFPTETEKDKVLSTIYHKATKAIPTQKGKNNAAYAQLLVSHAEHMSKKSPAEASNLFSQVRYLAKRFAIVHVAAAQFEKDQGNTTKAVKILEKAKESQAEPLDLIKKAFRNLHTNLPLVSDEDKEVAASYMIHTASSPENKENPDRPTNTSILLPLKSWIAKDPDIKPRMPSTSPVERNVESLVENKGRFYTDQIGSNQHRPTFSAENGDDNLHASKMKTPMPKPRTARGDKDSVGSNPDSKPTSDDDTYPSGSRNYQRSALRSYNSTPDCKNASLLSGGGMSSTKDSGRKSRILMASSRPMRVKRTSLPQLSEGFEESNNERNKFAVKDTLAEEPHDDITMKESTSTIDLLRPHSSKGGTSVMKKSEIEPMDTIDGALERELGVRKMSTGSDSGILDPVPSGGSSNAGSANSTATLQAGTPSTQVSAVPAPTVTSSSQAAVPPVQPAQPAPVLTPHPPAPAPYNAYPPQQHAVQYQQPQQMMMPPPTMAPPPANLLYVKGKVYTIIRMLGRGGSSKVYECLTPDTHMSVGIKCVSLDHVDSTIINSYKNEIALLKRLQYSHRVIKLIDFEHNQDSNTLYVIMEKGDTDLATFFRQRHKTGGMSSQLLSFYWMEMLEAVQVLHKEGIVHSDLKPANFLLVAGNLKLIDFGIANAIQQDMTSITLDQQVGTLNYMSPETIRDTCGGDNSGKPTIKIGVKSDVWSLGCILYNLVYGKTPFQHITNQICKLKAIMDDNVAITFPPIDNKDLLDTMQKCLVREPKQRYSIEDLLKHPYCK